MSDLNNCFVIKDKKYITLKFTLIKFTKDISLIKFLLKNWLKINKRKIKKYFKILWVAPFNFSKAGGIIRLIKWIALVLILKKRSKYWVWKYIDPK